MLNDRLIKLARCIDAQTAQINIAQTKKCIENNLIDYWSQGQTRQLHK